MIAKTMFTARGRREPIAYAKSIKAMLGCAILASMIGTLCVARMAMAEPAALTPADLAGRWASKENKLTLDISRCGEGWCGVVVANNSCGHTALRVGESPDHAIYLTGQSRELAGQLRLAANTEPYGVRVVLSRDDAGAIRLFVAGHSGGAFSAARRTYDYRELLVRNGNAACSPDPKSS